MIYIYIYDIYINVIHTYIYIYIMWYIYIYIIRSLVKHNISTYILHIPINKYCTCSSWIAGIPWPEDSCYHKGHLGIFALTTWRIIRLSNWLVTKVITNLWEDLPRIESEYLPLIVSAMILLKYEYHNFGVSENRAQICPNHPSHEWRILAFQPIISDLGIPHLKKPPNTSNMQFFYWHYTILEWFPHTKVNAYTRPAGRSPELNKVGVAWVKNFRDIKS